MPAFVRPFRPVLALVALLSGLSACGPPQDVADVRQVVKGSDEADATFSVQIVTRDTLPVFAEWPNSHPIRNLGWIAQQSAGSDAIIQPGDQLSLLVWDNDETSLLSQPGQKVIELPNLRVSSAGTVFLPYVDEVYVAKMTTAEARTAIQTKLVSIISSAQVQLTVVSGSKNSVEVLGVSIPGKIALTDRNTTVMSILAQTGGINAAVVNPQINLQRDGRLYRISSKRLFANPDLDTTLRGGDKIFIDRDDRYFMSLGSAGSERVVDFPRDSVTTLEAMSMIGGINENLANPKAILVLRNYPESAVRSMAKNGPPKQRMIFAFDLTNADGLFSAGEFQIQDRDLVLVTLSPLLNRTNIIRIFTTAILGTSAANTALTGG